MKVRLLDITAMMGVGYLLALVLFGDPVTALWGCTAPLIDKLLGVTMKACDCENCRMRRGVWGAKKYGYAPCKNAEPKKPGNPPPKKP